jgi:hypothetical protein
VHGLPRVAQLPIGGEERVLDDVLGLLAGAEHVSAERQDGAVMAVEQRLERGLGARADHRREAIVGQHPQHAHGHARRGPERRCGQRTRDSDTQLRT